VLARLRDATGETANLIVRDGEQAVYLDQVESRHALRHAGWAGRRIPLTRGAAAMALTGDDGPHVARDAVEVGVTAVACRILAPVESAAVGITAPSARMTQRRLPVCCREVQRAACDLSAAFGPPGKERAT
jgi:DNA-binding IclR family transcriptional regulator